MATLEQLQRGLIAADAAGNTEDAKAFADAIRAARASATPNPAEGMSAWERGLTGAVGAVAKFRDTVFPPANPISMLTKTGGEQDAETRQRKDDLATFERNKEGLGTAGKVGEIAAEVALSAAPVTRASTLGGAVLTKALGRMAPAAGDVLANAGYAAMTADPENRGEAALAGGAGAAGGRVLMKTLGGAARAVQGAKGSMSPEARTLYEAGVTPTPGQLFGDGPVGQIVRATEDKATSLPIAGDIIRNARARGIEQYNNVEINKALAPLGVTVKGAGEDAVASASRLVSDAYDRVLPNTALFPQDIQKALDATYGAMKGMPMLDVAQQAKVAHYMNMRVHPMIEQSVRAQQPIDGRTAKALDAEIGELARKYSSAADPQLHPMGEAMYELQSSLRDALTGLTPDATKELTKANTAYRGLLPAVKASNTALGQGGTFTPLQFERAAQKFGQDGSELNQAARRVLPSSIPNSGTADRLGTLAMFTHPIKTLAAGTVASVLYSRPGMHFIINGLSGVVPESIRAQLASMPPAQAARAIDELAKQNPVIGQTAQSLIPQFLRAYATQQQGGNDADE